MFYDPLTAEDSEAFCQNIGHKEATLFSYVKGIYLYFILNGLVLFLSFIISIRASLFFGGYMFLIWLYSHKIKKLPIIGNIT